MGILPESEWASWGTFFEGTFSSRWYNKHKTELLGVLLAAASDFLISISLSIQKCSHLRMARQAELQPFYRSKLWWCGAVLLGIGELGNFTAYGFAPIALIAPLGCVSIIGSAFISVIFLKKTMRAADILGGALAVVGTYLLVTFAPNVSQELTARQVQNDLVSWPFLVYVILEIIIFCILLYFYKRKAVKHIVVLLMMVALLASLTVIAVKAVASMIILSAKGKMQLTYPVFYIMLILMATSCVFQVKGHILSGIPKCSLPERVHVSVRVSVSAYNLHKCLYCNSIASWNPFFSQCLLSFLSVFVIAVNKKEERFQVPYIDCGCIPGQKLTGKIQPDSYGSCYGTLNNKDDSGKSQS
ncbi:NIPA-like protein 2 isoform X2 [Gallus gallus]|uniref:NIPA-like protein 2 isoform X2 n=1 Tax=Gallus gallus TaxID=9031 RepID=UPI001AE82B5B|nr:NIPA-like protein 2 isoform X2 [Gallus gallus]